MSNSATPCTIQSMEFSRPEYWSGWPFPSPGDLPNLGIELGSPALQVDSLPAEPQGKPEPYVTIEHLRYAIIYSLDFQDSVRKECKISVFFFSSGYILPLDFYILDIYILD